MLRIVRKATAPSVDAGQRLLFEDSPVFPGGHFRSEAHLSRRIGYLDARRNGLDLQAFLKEENSFATLTPEQTANIEAAASDRAVYVLTGQQPGLFGGPILWYYKALTCAALARDAARKLNRPVIPVFWIAGDDSDLAECNGVELPEASAAGLPGPWSLEFPEPRRPLAMGERHIDSVSLESLLGRLHPIWNPDTIDFLRGTLVAPKTLASAFKHLAQSLLGREGILFVDGYSPRLRRRARPVLEKAVADRSRWETWLASGSAAAVTAGLPQQVALRPGVAHAFRLEKGERIRLYGEENPDGLRRRIYTQENPGENLLPRIPDLELTHDVFSRPLIAEAIFPVLGHVLGPAELRYFGQMSILFPQVTGGIPMLHPRMTAAVAPESSWNSFAASGWAPAEAATLGLRSMRESLSERAWQAHPASRNLSYAGAEKWLDEVKAAHGLHFRDSGALLRLEKKMAVAWRHYLQALRRGLSATTQSEAVDLVNALRWLGNGLGQDRHLTLPSLRNALGAQGLSDLRESLDPLATDLQIFGFADTSNGSDS